jgi:F0F1-type ATP synthase membrane subunit b/b'
VSPHEAHGLPWKELLAPQITNFTIFAGLLVMFLRKPLANHFAGKSDEFEAQKRKAETARKQAEQQNFEVHRLVKEHEETADRSLAEARRYSEELMKRMIQDAKTSAAKTVEEAGKMAEFEWARAISALRVELITNSTQMAEKNLSTQADDNVQTKLNEEVIHRIEKLPAGGRA